MSLLIGFLTLVLVLVCLFMVLIILMQKARSDGGMGAALGGGGAAESAFGAETSNILTRATIFCAILFFLLTFGLYLIQQYRYHQSDRPDLPATLPTIVDPEEETPGIRFPGMDDFPEEDLPEGVSIEDLPGIEDAPEGIEEETIPVPEESGDGDELPEPDEISSDLPETDEETLAEEREEN